MISLWTRLDQDYSAHARGPARLTALVRFASAPRALEIARGVSDGVAKRLEEKIREEARKERERALKDYDTLQASCQINTIAGLHSMRNKHLMEPLSFSSQTH
jgi:hypothetical protein